MLINTADLTGAALDWAASAAHGDRDIHLYSSDWAIGGPIIESAEIDLTHQIGGGCVAALMFNKWIYEEVGPTPLIAAMRCYVATRFGSEIDVPDEFLEK